MAKVIRFPALDRNQAVTCGRTQSAAAPYNQRRVATKQESLTEAGARIWLGDWLVEPSLNRISRGGAVVQVELKVMDLLVYLAGRAGEVVDKREIQDAVWQTEFVSYNTVAGRVSELREALQDDAREPRYLETIHGRGYRLIADVRSSAGPEPDAAAIAAGPQEGTEERPPYPGLSSFTEADAEDFFGREAEIAELWRKITSRRLLAVIGASGAGKSSLLRAGVVARAPPAGGRWRASPARTRSWRSRGRWRRTSWTIRRR